MTAQEELKELRDQYRELVHAEAVDACILIHIDRVLDIKALMQHSWMNNLTVKHYEEMKELLNGQDG